MELTNLESNIIKQYHKAIVHMRQKNDSNELMLCLGAGASRDLEIPNWWKLVERLSKNEEVQGTTIFNSELSLTSKAQALYEHYKMKRLKRSNGKISCQDDVILRHDWIRLIHTELYRNYSKRLEHPYLMQYIDIIKKSPITINYNFDDFIEQIIREKSNNAIDKGYETTFRPSINFKRKNGVIYHPNGFLPEKLEEGYSDHFVFSEKSFQDQLLDSIMGHYSPLTYFFSRYTALFIGVSMEDQTLRHMLRQNAVINPGHFHYYIFFKDEKFSLSEEEMKSIQESYFDTFNLIVIFLDNDGIRYLGRLLNMASHEFEDILNGEGLSTLFNYYISGAPGTGKTTVLEMLRNFRVFNEWPDIKHKNLDKADCELSKSERIELDLWISRQFRLKNRLVSENNSGIQLIDRSPLDPITYAVSKDAVKKRANELKRSYRRAEIDKELVSGQIIMFTANAECVYRRLNIRNPNQYSSDWCQSKIIQFEQLFNEEDVKTIDTSNLSIVEITKKLAHTIYFEEYHASNLNIYLEEYCNGTRTFSS